MPDIPPVNGSDQSDPYADDDLTGLAGTADETDMPHGYVSDAELMAWLQTKSGTQYDELREQMKISTGRQDLIKELNDLKSAISHAGTSDKIEEVRTKMEDLLAKYKDTAYATELTSLLGGALDALNYPHDGTVMEENAAFGHDAAVLAPLTDTITSETDKLGKIDGLALVQIQSLVSDAKETTQLASNVLSSRDQTRGGIIGNIRA